MKSGRKTSAPTRSAAPKRATIRDVARRAKVSIGTVSRVMSGVTPVSSDLRLRVSEAVEALNFAPRVRRARHAPARARLIGCLVSDIANLFYARVIGAAEARLEQAGYTLVIVSTGDRPGRIDELLPMLRDRNFDGAILSFGQETRPGLGEELQHINVPAIILDRTEPAGVDSIHVDHRSGARQACNYLLGLGHRRIALITASRSIRPGKDRIAGYHEALQQWGAPSPDALIRSDCVSADAAYSEMARMLQSTERPTAVISLGSQALAGILRAIGSAGLSVPHDISVIALGDSEFARVVSPSISCIHWDLWQLGQQTADILIHRMSNRAAPTRSVTLPTELILRHSCAAPPHEKWTGAPLRQVGRP